MLKKKKMRKRVLITLNELTFAGFEIVISIISLAYGCEDKLHRGEKTSRTYFVSQHIMNGTNSNGNAGEKVARKLVFYLRGRRLASPSEQTMNISVLTQLCSPTPAQHTQIHKGKHAHRHA